MDTPKTALSRRNVLMGLAAGTAAVAAIVVPKLNPVASQRTRRLLAGNRFTRGFLSLAHADHAEWTAQVGSVFSVGGGYRMRLAGVQPLASTGSRPSHLRSRAFAAVFDVMDGVSLPSDLIYAVSHSQYGGLPIFLSATGNPRRMLAVFN